VSLALIFGAISFRDSYNYNIMSIFEKIASVIIAILFIGISIFSYHEFNEPSKEQSMPKQDVPFEQSVGQDFKIGPFTTIVNETSSDSLENGCESLKPEIIGALHDIKEHLETAQLPTLSPPSQDTFEVNEPVLELLCHTSAEITLADDSGNHLVLEKIPFTRTIPQGGQAADIGTEVRINATVISVGALPPSTPTTFGDVLIPDRYLDVGTSSANPR
jgi:hypothetical protein